MPVRTTPRRFRAERPRLTTRATGAPVARPKDEEQADLTNDGVPVELDVLELRRLWGNPRFEVSDLARRYRRTVSQIYTYARNLGLLPRREAIRQTIDQAVLQAEGRFHPGQVADMIGVSTSVVRRRARELRTPLLAPTRERPRPEPTVVLLSPRFPGIGINCSRCGCFHPAEDRERKPASRYCCLKCGYQIFPPLRR
jgi:hypothetical protein